MSKNKTYIKLMNSKEWRKIRNDYLSEHPLCEQCSKDGYVTAAQCVHHITPVETGRNDKECEELAYSVSNLMALCFKCHSAIHTAKRYHTKEEHKRRSLQALEQWVSRHRKTPPG